MGTNLPDRIKEFIAEHHIFTLATSKNNIPWTSTCFYVFDESNNRFLFTSDDHTRHVDELNGNGNVAGAIALETKTIGKIRGLQFSGIVTKLEGVEKRKAKTHYLKAFPYAILKKTEMWELKVSLFKMTDNRLGFGKKLIWENPSIDKEKL